MRKGSASFASTPHHEESSLIVFVLDSISVLGFLANVANKAGQTVSATATKLKHTVESNVSNVLRILPLSLETVFVTRVVF